MATGCLLYDSIFPNFTGQNQLITNFPIYNNLNEINVRYYDGDPNYGIRSNTLRPYYGQHCFIQNGRFISNTGTLVEYDPANISYPPQQNVPLDTYDFVLLFAVMVTAIFYIKNINLFKWKSL